MSSSQPWLKDLSPTDKLRLVHALVRQVLEQQPETQPQPAGSLRGILKHLGPAPSAEEIDEAREEMWGNFPRDDI